MNPQEGKRSRNVRKVTGYLLDALLQLPYGGRLPGIRTIMKQTGTGQITVSHALEILQKDGLIRINPDRGIYRIKPDEKQREIRLLNWQDLGSDENISFFGLLYRRLIELAAADGWKITMENAVDRLPEELTGELVGNGITRCFVGSAAIPDFANCLKKRMKICLELLPRHQDQVTTELRGASDMTVRQLDYLFKRGYRRIGYLHFCGVDMARYPVQVLRLMDFYRIMAENGLRVDPAWVLYCQDDYGNLDAGMAKMLKTDPKPEALIVPGTAIRELYSFCRKNKIRIGKDLAVFCCDDIHEKLVPEATVITNNPKDIAETFWEMFQAAERGEKVPNRRTEFFIRTGQTVPNLKTAAGR